MRWLVFAYACAAYVLAARVMIYLVGFLGNVFVAKSVDSGVAGPAGAALAVDGALLVSFGVSHSLLARQAVKNALAARTAGPVGRSTYVLVSALTLALVIWQWRPLPRVLWEVSRPVGQATLIGLSAAGWILALVSSHTLGHFDLYGVRPAWLYALRREEPLAALKTGHLYGLARHPMYAGFALGIWSSPRMTEGHFLFAAAMTVYLIVGMRFEEKDLERRFGQSYLDYRQRVARITPLRSVPAVRRPRPIDRGGRSA